MIEAGTIAARFFETAACFGDQAFLRIDAATARAYGIAAGDVSYARAAGRVSNLIAAYQRLDYGEGDRIGLALENRPDFFLHFLAINAIGASITPLNGAMQLRDLAYQISHSDCDLIVASSASRESVAQASRETGAAMRLVGADLAGAPKSRRNNAGPVDIAPRREAAILYTSGTTGAPKGCVLTNEYFTAIGGFYTGLGGHIRFDAGKERIITPLPVTHMNALACSFMAAVETGGCLIQLDRFHPKSWWSSVRESDATIMHYLGVMPAMLLSAPASPGDDFSGQIKFAFGAGCDPRHHDAFERRFGIKLIEAWAMTETGAGAWITASHEPRRVGTRCFGRAPENLEWRLVDVQGRDVPAGADGELLVRRRGAEARRHFFAGYHKDAQATEEAWRGGWLHTGDVVRVDEDGLFYFVDRRKNVIRRSGENIAAIEVESVLMRCAAVAACVVIPVPDEIRGDEVMALIAPSDEGADGSVARAIFDFTRANLAYFKTPGYIAFVEKLPLTATEKVQRGEAKEIGQTMLAAGQAHDFRTLKKRDRAGVKLSRRDRQDYQGVVAAAPITIPYQRYSAHSAYWWIGAALRGLRERAGVATQEIDGLCASSFTLAPDNAVALAQYLGMTPRWLDHMPMGGASGVVALRRAARAVQAGDAEIIACVAGETNHRHSFEALVENFSRFSRQASFPYGEAGPNAPFALITDAYMKTYGATREDFGRLCIAQRINAMSNPAALLTEPLTMDAYLAARPIAEPLHLFDCVMPCAGAEGYLVMRDETALALGLPYARILSTIERHNAFPDDPVQLRGGWAADKDELWSMAGIAPDAVDFLQTYDDYPVISMMQIEDLGFCDKGEAKDFVRSRSMIFDGDFPHNVSGGQLSVGQAGAAGGYLGLVEALRQLTGEAIGGAVKNARIGVVSGFGMINYDRGVCSAAAILASGNAHV